MSLNLDLFCCQNIKCSLFGIRNTGKITVTYKYGKNKDKSMLRCKECTHRFCETKGTVYYRSHKPKEKVDSILRHTQEGVGLRKTSRLEEVDKNTVGRYIKVAGQHAYKLHEELVAFSPLHTKSSVR